MIRSGVYCLDRFEMKKTCFHHYMRRSMTIHIHFIPDSFDGRGSEVPLVYSFLFSVNTQSNCEKASASKQRIH